VQSAHGGQAIAGLASPRLSNEDLYSFQKLFREQLESNNLDHLIGSAGESAHDDQGALLGVGAGTNLMNLGAGTTVLVIGADPEEESPIHMLRLRAIAQRGGKLIVANLRPTKLDRSASTRLRYKAGADLLFVRGLLRAALDAGGSERLTTRNSGLDQLRRSLFESSLESLAEGAGVSADELKAAAAALIEAENGIIVYGAEARSGGPAVVEAIGALATLSGKVGKANSGLVALLPGGNSRGALDMGVRPDARPGYAPLSQPAIGARDLWEAARSGRVRAIWLAGLDPAASLPAAQAALDAAEFVVVQELFLTETARLADVVLPAASVAERDGTYTNAERRVQRSRQARPAVGQSRPDWQIVQGVAKLLAAMVVPAAPVAAKAAPANAKAAPAKGRPGATATRQATVVAERPSWDYITAADVAAEIAERVPGYAGVTYAALAATGKPGNWGRQVNEAIYYDGTNYENTEGVGIQLPSLIEGGKASVSLTPRQAATSASDERPLLLLAQPLAYDGTPLLRGSKLESHVPGPYIALSSADAERQNIHPGDSVRLDSAAGSLTLPARVVVDLPPGVAMVPADMPSAQIAAVQTGPRTRVNLVKVVV
jgi:NADH-quinone oxidoreductase subunit G